MSARVYEPVEIARRLSGVLLPLALLVTAFGFACAREAESRGATVALRLPAKVLTCQPMTSGAMRLSCIRRDEVLAAERVHAMRHSVQMRGVDARAIAARVVDLAASRDRAFKHLECDAVRQTPPGFWIALLRQRAGPYPTVVLSATTGGESPRKKVATSHG